MTVDARLFTAEELLRLPEDGGRYELVQGELKRMSPSGAEHSRIAILIASSLVAYVTRHRLGAVFGADAGFLLSRNPDTLRSPDAAFVSAERFVRTPEFFPGAPDLAVEVISPSDLVSEVNAKTAQYLRAGTRAVVVVDPENRIVHVHRGADDVRAMAETLEVDDVVPGWKMPLAEIFES